MLVAFLGTAFFQYAVLSRSQINKSGKSMEEIDQTISVTFEP